MYYSLLDEIITHVMQAITGRLLTKKQIKEITDDSIGRYFSAIFPQASEDVSRQSQLEAAKLHIEAASEIVGGLRTELVAQSAALEELMAEIAEKQNIAAQYAELANTNQEAAEAVKTEIKSAISAELQARSADGRVVRRAASAILWIVTLIIGAALGAYFKDLIDFLERVLITD